MRQDGLAVWLATSTLPVGQQRSVQGAGSAAASARQQAAAATACTRRCWDPESALLQH